MDEIQPTPTISDNPATDTFFAASRTGCLIFLACLAIVVIGTTWELAMRLTAEEMLVTGVAGPLQETRENSSWQALYGFTLQTEEGDVHFVRVQNHGQILNFLRERPVAQGSIEQQATDRVVTVRIRNGVAQSIRLHDGDAPEGNAPEIAERHASNASLALAGSVAAAILVAAFWSMGGK